jgi:uncharacterized membrane protein
MTGLPLLGIVYYGGGALTTPEQSAGLAMGVGFTFLFVGWLIYDTLWRFVGNRPPVAMLISLVLLGSAGIWLGRVMTGRAVFIHIGAMLGTILLVNVQERIWPVESRRLAPAAAGQPTSAMIDRAAERLRHNAALAIAVILLMVSNHFPLMYGHAQAWIIPPAIIGVVWLTCHLVFVWTPTRAPRHA